MANHAKAFKAAKSATTLLVLFIPSHNRKQRATFDQLHWIDEENHAALRIQIC